MKIYVKRGSENPKIHTSITVELDGQYKVPWYEDIRGKDFLRGRSLWPLKRILDVMLCIMALPFVLTVILLTCILIKIESRGPAIFVQMRTGKGGQRFKMFMLRTRIYPDIELKKHFLLLKELSYKDSNFVDNSPATRIGVLLQKYNIEHLPQIFNVLRGEMSLVGPRPTAISSNNYELWQTERLEVTPGITGLWQISGHDKSDFNERLRLDIAYIRNQNFLLDVQILLRTIGYVFARNDVR